MFGGSFCAENTNWTDAEVEVEVEAEVESE
jgi:hypothetical protein